MFRFFAPTARSQALSSFDALKRHYASNLFVVSLEYKKPLHEVDEHLTAHRIFLEQAYEEGHFIVSGRKNPRTGGIILAKGANKAAIEALIKNDPFHRRGIADYSITEFQPTKYHEKMHSILEDKVTTPRPK